MAKISRSLATLLCALVLMGCANRLTDKNLISKSDEIRRSLSGENPVVAVCLGGVATADKVDLIPGVCALGKGAWSFWAQDRTSGLMRVTIAAEMSAWQSFGYVKSFRGVINPTAPVFYQIQVRTRDLTEVFDIPEKESLPFISELRARKIPEASNISEIWLSSHEPAIPVIILVPTR